MFVLGMLFVAVATHAAARLNSGKKSMNSFQQEIIWSNILTRNIFTRKGIYLQEKATFKVKR